MSRCRAIVPILQHWARCDKGTYRRALRRHPLFYTNLVRDPEPSREGFGAIFWRVCKEHGLQADESVADYLLARWHERLGAHLKVLLPPQPSRGRPEGHALRFQSGQSQRHPRWRPPARTLAAAGHRRGRAAATTASPGLRRLQDSGRRKAGGGCTPVLWRRHDLEPPI